MDKKKDHNDSLMTSSGLDDEIVSHMEMTGLIPALASDEYEADSYEDIEDYKA